MTTTVFLDNPSLPALDNDLFRIDLEGTHRVYYHGTVLALWDASQIYPIPGMGEIVNVLALEGLIQLLTTDEQFSVSAQPVAPFRIEIVPPGGTPSQPIHHIPFNAEWIAHDDLDTDELGPEARTRQEFIDPALAHRGWVGALLASEVSFRSSIDQSLRRVDYALSIAPTPGSTPVLVAYLEAKHKDLPPAYGLEQARLYAEGRRAHIRWVFATNGHAFVAFDRLTTVRSGPFPLTDFPSPQELAASYQPGQMIDPPEIDKDLSHASRSRGLDRNDPEVAQSVIERLLDPACRLPFLDLLVQSIQIAHKVNSGSWSLTLDSNGRFIRLNVSKMEVCAIFQGQGHLVLDAGALTIEAQRRAEHYALLGKRGVYQTVPSSMLCDFLSEHLPELLPILQPSYQALIAKAAQTVKRRTGLAKFHSPGIITYLRNATGRDVPEPVYA